MDGDEGARKVTEGYVLQRFVTACAGAVRSQSNSTGPFLRWTGAKNEKVNGLETVAIMAGDYRDWGGQYWFQNTRAMYWPDDQAGDFDLIQPLFRMYRAFLESNAKEVKDFYGHDGAYFCETAPFYGGIRKLKVSGLRRLHGFLLHADPGN